MTRQIFPDFGAEVMTTRQGKSFKIFFEEVECTIYLNSEKVQYVAEMTSEDIALIAVLLAHIECIRKDTSDADHKTKKLEDDTMAEAINNLLSNYMIEDLINIFSTLKWHEIVLVMEADEPLNQLEEIL